jgi:hypothetical protein
LPVDLHRRARRPTGDDTFSISLSNGHVSTDAPLSVGRNMVIVVIAATNL